MISPLSELNVLGNVRFFNLRINEDDEQEIYSILSPVNSLFRAHKNNSIYIFKDGENVHAEALININGILRKSQAMGQSAVDVLKKLVPRILKNTSMMARVYERNYELVG
ncbi:hypothetical protein [Bacteriovorax sp. Seq25_V]|uniref:hypothetical protein n=1 Tax=Bacteriovorax sp. Seq25_V TaxID=1201288 RepID=UPI000389F12D|nr:hypothetical protein [Bacteriovorax sp. Seq25_V]EQC47513.1 hypothetical protein M900_0924 [Bacteriovorax sp. Seq25_V]